MENNAPSGNGLKRVLGLFPLTNIVVANMIGAGIFTTTGLLMADLGDPLLLLVLWIAGGFIALCGALSYGELGAAIPKAGGEYIFLSRLYHPLLGFMSGWVSFFAGFSAPIAASAIGFTEYLTRAFPELTNSGILSDHGETIVLKKSLSIIVILVFTAIHMRGIRIGAAVQNVLTIMKVLLLVGLLCLGFILGNGDLHHLSGGESFSFDFGGWKTIGLSLMWIMFAYSGWNAAAYIGSEVKDPEKNMPWSLLLGTGVVIFLYFLLNLYYVYAIPPGEMEGVISVAGLAAGSSLGGSFESVVSLLIAFALFSSLSAFVILGPRVYYSMAEDGYFFRFASVIGRKSSVPSRSIFLQGIFASILVLFGTFDQILTYMGFSLGIFPILCIAGVFKLRKSKVIGYHMPGFPLVPIFYISAGVSILTLAFFERPLESSIALLTVLAGIPAYLFFRKRRGKIAGNPSTREE